MKFLRASVTTLLCCLDFLHFSALSNILQVFAMRPAAARQQTDYFRFISKSRTYTHTPKHTKHWHARHSTTLFWEHLFCMARNVGWLIFCSFELYFSLDWIFGLFLQDSAFYLPVFVGGPLCFSKQNPVFLVVEISAGRLVQQKSGGNSTRNAAWIK